MYKLRELSKSDLAEINKWRANRELLLNLGAPYRYIDLVIDEMWYENYLKNRDNTIRCAIVEEGKNLILGLITLAKLNYINKNAVLHIMIGPDNQKKGIGTFAIKEMLKHAFLDMNLERIELEVIEDNEIAKSLYHKVGFKQEGIRRKACFKDGKYKNMIMMSILKEEYKEK